jgi:hypothetical protein
VPEVGNEIEKSQPQECSLSPRSLRIVLFRQLLKTSAFT